MTAGATVSGFDGNRAALACAPAGNRRHGNLTGAVWFQVYGVA